jgi:hypothetical protein
MKLMKRRGEKKNFLRFQTIEEIKKSLPRKKQPS